MYSPLIGATTGYAPSVLGFVIPYGNIGNSIEAQEHLDMLHDIHPLLSGQYAEHVIADDGIVSSTCEEIWLIVGVVVEPFRWIDVTTLTTPVIHNTAHN